MSDPTFRKLVLVVDDEPVVREIYTLALAAADYRVLVAADATRGLEMLDAEPGVAVVISDLALPGMDGLSFAAEVRRRRPAVPILITTGLCGSELRGQALAQGVMAVLEKPVELDGLVAAVGRAVHAAVPAPAVREGNGARVLVADDDAAVREALCRALAEVGYVPVEARDGVEAFERTLARQIDAALVDLHMPRLDGVAGIGALRHLDPNLTLVAMTGGGEAIAREALDAGALTCLQKPIALARLWETVARAVALTRERRVRAPVAGARPPSRRLRALAGA